MAAAAYESAAVATCEPLSAAASFGSAAASYESAAASCESAAAICESVAAEAWESVAVAKFESVAVAAAYMVWLRGGLRNVEVGNEKGKQNMDSEGGLKK